MEPRRRAPAGPRGGERGRLGILIGLDHRGSTTTALAVRAIGIADQGETTAAAGRPLGPKLRH